MTPPIKLMTNTKEIAELLIAGKVGIIPTDTLYGIVARASDKEAVTRLYSLKSRRTDPGTVVASSIEQIAELGIPVRYLKPIEHFWPGPVSVVVPTAPGMAYLDLEKFAIAIRIPSDKKVLELLELLTTSTNRPGEMPAKTIQEAESIFEDKVDFYVDGGDLSERKPSTIIRVVDDAVEVLREGAVKVYEETGEIVA
jgi:L-threonylcarbamoyladenylate synthase